MATSSRKVRTFRGGEYVANLMAELSRAAIAQRIALAREQAGLTQPELGDLMHVHFRTVQDWESPKKQATPWDRLDELAGITGTTKNWFLHGEHAEAGVDSPLILRRLEELSDRLEQTRQLVAEGFGLQDRARELEAELQPAPEDLPAPDEAEESR